MPEVRGPKLEFKGYVQFEGDDAIAILLDELNKRYTMRGLGIVQRFPRGTKLRLTFNPGMIGVVHPQGVQWSPTANLVDKMGEGPASERALSRLSSLSALKLRGLMTLLTPELFHRVGEFIGRLERAHAEEAADRGHPIPPAIDGCSHADPMGCCSHPRAVSPECHKWAGCPVKEEAKRGSG